MKFEGVMPALITPLKEDESINVEVLHKLIDDLLQKGADGFYVGGYTGEGLALRTEERMILAEESVKAINGRKPCIVQVASTDFSNVVALAKQAEKCGADAISSTAPIFFGYNESEVYDYYKALAESVNIPLMIYYSPAAGFNMTADFAAKMFEIDNITAIKWTSSNYYEMMRLKDLTKGEMNVINGPDEMLLMGLNAGADGGIGTTYNFIFEKIKAVYDNFKKGDIAAAQCEQTNANRIISELLKHRLLPAAKAVLEAQGYAVGNAAFPMKKYTNEEKAEIIEGFKKAGLKF